jgi:isopentenyl diphosphate isomerase/L-lactate dehydrogenase-like FMN-dependent dehydrogenase
VAEEPPFFEHKGKRYTPASQAPPPGGNQEFFEEAMQYQVALAAVEALHAAKQAASALSTSCQAAKDVLAAPSLDHALQQHVDRDPDVLQAACITLAAGCKTAITQSKGCSKHFARYTSAVCFPA